MGDAGRNNVFAKFIKQNFPKAKTVLCVGDGKCRLANKLLLLGYKPSVIEPNPRAKHIRPGVSYHQGLLERTSFVDADIIIGMHPDEATPEIILAAELHNKSWAIVPCCIVGPEAAGVRSFEDWIKKLRNLSNCPQQVQRGTLDMFGKNTILWRKMKTN